MPILKEICDNFLSPINYYCLSSTWNIDDIKQNLCRHSRSFIILEIHWSYTICHIWRRQISDMKSDLDKSYSFVVEAVFIVYFICTASIIFFPTISNCDDKCNVHSNIVFTKTINLDQGISLVRNVYLQYTLMLEREKSLFCLLLS